MRAGCRAVNQHFGCGSRWGIGDLQSLMRVREAHEGSQEEADGLGTWTQCDWRLH